MNQRINHLLDQAKLTAVQEMFEPELYKFAELIVRECALIADIADENGCEWIGGNVLAHFGVKE